VQFAMEFEFWMLAKNGLSRILAVGWGKFCYNCTVFGFINLSMIF